MSRIQSAVPQQVNQALQVAGDQNLKQQQIDNAAMANAASAKNQAERTQAMLRGQDQRTISEAVNAAADRDARLASQQIQIAAQKESDAATAALERERLDQIKENNERIYQQQIKEFEHTKTVTEREYNLNKKIREEELSIRSAEALDTIDNEKRLESYKKQLYDLHARKMRADDLQRGYKRNYPQLAVEVADDAEEVAKSLDGFSGIAQGNLTSSNIVGRIFNKPGRNLKDKVEDSVFGFFGSNTSEEREALQLLKNPFEAQRQLQVAFEDSLASFIGDSENADKVNLYGSQMIGDLLAGREITPEFFAKAEKDGVSTMVLQSAARNFADLYSKQTKEYIGIPRYTAEDVESQGFLQAGGSDDSPIEGFSKAQVAVLGALFNSETSNNLVKGTSGFIDADQIRNQAKIFSASLNPDSSQVGLERLEEMIGGSINTEEISSLLIDILSGQEDMVDIENLIDQSTLESQFESGKAPPQRRTAEVLREFLGDE